MYYVEGYKLPFTEYTSCYDMYPNIGERDIQIAQYVRVPGFEHRPDICALPPLLTGSALVQANSSCPQPTDLQIRRMSKSERMFAVWRIKQTVKAFLPWHIEMERRFRECIVSAYMQRRFAISEGNDIAKQDKLLSMADPIAPSVSDASLIGTAGTGKSTAVRLMLDRYPKGIYHTMPDGKRILQIPYLELTAYNDTNIKAMYYDMLSQIDRITGNDYFVQYSQKKMDVQTLEYHVGALFELYHIAILVIDEIQLSKDKQIFDHLLRLTAHCGVALMLIGTEEAVEMLNKVEWFGRRFSHLGKIVSDMNISTSYAIKENVIRQIWRTQWTLQHYDCTSDIVDFFITEGGGNVDLITSIFAMAQMMVIETEGTDHELALDLQTLNKAADRFPLAKKLILGGVSTIESAYIKERAEQTSAIERAAQRMQEEELNKLNTQVMELSSKKADTLADLTWRIMAVEDTTEKAIKKAYERMTAEGVDFTSMSGKQGAKVLMTALRGKTAKSTAKKQAPKKRVKPETPFEDVITEEVEKHDAVGI